MHFRRKLALIGLAGLLLMGGCIPTNPLMERTGTLQGRVTIGPLCPVEPCNLPPERVAQIYTARRIIVYQQPTGIRIAETPLNADGTYSLTLLPGNYLVDVSDADGNPLPLDPARRPFVGSANPKEVEIRAGAITVLDFDIDTGIRGAVGAAG